MTSMGWTNGYAMERLNKESDYAISTGSSDFDSVLQGAGTKQLLLSLNSWFTENLTDLCCTGGFACGEITELYGESGCGKTQICLQLCVMAQVSLHVI